MRGNSSQKPGPIKNAECLVSARSRVREPDDNHNQTLTAKSLEMDVLEAKKRALDAQRAAEDAISKANGAWEALENPDGQEQSGAPSLTDSVPVAVAVDEAAAKIIAAMESATEAVIYAQSDALAKACAWLIVELKEILTVQEGDYHGMSSSAKGIRQGHPEVDQSD